MDDARIVELFLDKDETAVSEIGKKYGERLLAIAFRITGDRSAAEECVNSAYQRAWELIPPAEPSSYLFAFMGRIVRGLAIDSYRRERAASRSAVTVELTRELEAVLPWNGSVEGEAEANELGALINGFVRALPKDRRLIFIRRYWYCDTVAEIAESLGFSESKVKTELFRARKKLKEQLERKGYSI